MATPVSHYLVRFGASEAEDSIPMPEVPGFVASFEPAPPVDIEALMAQARAEGVMDGEVAAAAAAEARLVEERQAFEERLDAARQSWSVEQADRLAGMIEVGLAQLESSIAASTVDVLRPFVSEALGARAVEQLADALSSLTHDAACPAIRISGPSGLLAALAARLGAPVGVEFSAEEGTPDVSILAGQTLIESRLAAWAARLRTDEE